MEDKGRIGGKNKDEVGGMIERARLCQDIGGMGQIRIEGNMLVTYQELVGHIHHGHL